MNRHVTLENDARWDRFLVALNLLALHNYTGRFLVDMQNGRLERSAMRFVEKTVEKELQCQTMR